MENPLMTSFTFFKPHLTRWMVCKVKQSKEIFLICIIMASLSWGMCDQGDGDTKKRFVRLIDIKYRVKTVTKVDLCKAWNLIWFFSRTLCQVTGNSTIKIRRMISRKLTPCFAKYWRIPKIEPIIPIIIELTPISSKEISGFFSKKNFPMTWQND